MNLYDTATPWLLPDHSLFHHTDDRMLSHYGGGGHTMLKKRKTPRERTRYPRERKKYRKGQREAIHPGQRRLQFAGINASPVPSRSPSVSANIPSRSPSMERSSLRKRSRTRSVPRKIKKQKGFSKTERERLVREAKTLADTLPDRTAQQASREEEWRARYRENKYLSRKNQVRNAKLFALHPFRNAKLCVNPHR